MAQIRSRIYAHIGCTDNYVCDGVFECLSESLIILTGVHILGNWIRVIKVAKAQVSLQFRITRTSHIEVDKLYYNTHALFSSTNSRI